MAVCFIKYVIIINKYNMYKELINHIRDLFLRYKLVHTVRYQSKLLNNAQNNYQGFQVYIEDQTYSRFNITTNIFVVTVNIWILHMPGQDRESILNIQDNAYSIANSVLNRIDYSGASVYDYDITTVSHITDDDSAGVRLTLQLQVPLDGLCDEYEYREQPISQDEEDKEINVQQRVDKDIKINPIKLERIPKC